MLPDRIRHRYNYLPPSTLLSTTHELRNDLLVATELGNRIVRELPVSDFVVELRCNTPQNFGVLRLVPTQPIQRATHRTAPTSALARPAAVYRPDGGEERILRSL
ncbi:hypothetical protein C8Q80DRAFT_1208935 [Daedaleopsis nitida]|nr:hypothetical protein C8Q80DRAFT_1208894 [Daedaleopsis nitida]KAI0738417.1 hypothetical protein C8Q80DRAFT_1208935 [Daedaleopsis nitida]